MLSRSPWGHVRVNTRPTPLVGLVTTAAAVCEKSPAKEWRRLLEETVSSSPA